MYTKGENSNLLNNCIMDGISIKLLSISKSTVSIHFALRLGTSQTSDVDLFARQGGVHNGAGRCSAGKSEQNSRCRGTIGRFSLDFVIVLI